MEGPSGPFIFLFLNKDSFFCFPKNPRGENLVGFADITSRIMNPLRKEVMSKIKWIMTFVGTIVVANFIHDLFGALMKDLAERFEDKTADSQ
jgi:hypothetical protein